MRGLYFKYIDGGVSSDDLDICCPKQRSKGFILFFIKELLIEKFEEYTRLCQY